MIYKRSERLSGTSTKFLYLRKIVLILLVVLLSIASFLLFKNTGPTVIKYKVQNKIIPVDQSISITDAPGGGGGGGEGSDSKHSEVFVFTEPEPNNLIRHNIFIYDSATGEKKQLTGTDMEKFSINPKFSADGKKIYFAKAINQFFYIYSMDLNGENLNFVVIAGKANFSISGTRILYIDNLRHIRILELDKTKSAENCVYNNDNEYDFPMLSKDGKTFYFVSISRLYRKYDIYCGNREKNQKYLFEAEVIFHSEFDHIAGIELSPDDKFLLITFGTNVLKIFDIDKKEIIRVFSSGKDSIVVGATWSDDSKSVYWIRSSPYNNIAKINIEESNAEMASDVIVPNFTGYFVSLKPTIGDGGVSGGAGIEPNSFIYAAQVFPQSNCAFIYTRTLSPDTIIQLTGTEKDPRFNQIFWDSNPKYSPDCKTIAFCRSKDKLNSEHWIYTIKADGSNIIELVKVNYCHNFSFSNDSKTLFYVSPSNDINSINIETGKVTLITNEKSPLKSFPIYIEESKTGSKYVYYLFDERGTYNLCRIILNDDVNPFKKEVVFHFSRGFYYILSLSFSPDSSKILCKSKNSISFIIDLNSKTLSANYGIHPRFVNVETMSSSFWSNDGKSVYFYSGHPHNYLEKYDVDKLNYESITIVLNNLPYIDGISLKPARPS